MRGFEITKLLHYTADQQFALHSDFLPTNTPELRQEIDRRGQRVITLLVYLNDDYEGGATEFPRIGLRFRGKRGDALIFRNIDAAGSPEGHGFDFLWRSDGTHAGTRHLIPPESGHVDELERAMPFKRGGEG